MEGQPTGRRDGFRGNDLSSPTILYNLKDPMLGLMIYYCHFDILNNFLCVFVMTRVLGLLNQ